MGEAIDEIMEAWSQVKWRERGRKEVEGKEIGRGVKGRQGVRESQVKSRKSEGKAREGKGRKVREKSRKGEL
jgi:hypothetical protein